MPEEHGHEHQPKQDGYAAADPIRSSAKGNMFTKRQNYSVGGNRHLMSLSWKAK